ncbi:major facilitator superfamily domain-containing protein [Armillaria nabsnona]|nr:major facilitator superfamily domain-containing protein [Armillaria nabsnona]
MDEKYAHKEGSAEDKLSDEDSPRILSPLMDVRRVPWWKLDIQILPVVTIMYLLNFLDRGNIGNARVAGLQANLGITDSQYSLLLTATLIPYALVEIPSNLFLTRIGAHIVLPALVVIWGAVTAFQGLVTSYGGLVVACRVILGCCEGGLLPGLSLYVASFYPRSKLQLRIALFFASTALAGAFSGLLASAIEHLDGHGGRPAWKYIFILEGSFTVLYGLVCFVIMPRSLSTIPLLTPEERSNAEALLIQEHTMLEKDDHFSWSSTLGALFQPHVLLYFVMGFFGGLTLTALAYFEPGIVQSLGYTANRAQLMSVPPFAVAWAVNIITAFVSDRYRLRGVTVIFHSLLATIGFAVFLGSKSHDVRYGSLFLFVTGVYCIPPSLLAWAANNSAPRFRRAAVIAFLLSSTSLGGILATWLFGSLSKPPNYNNATIVSIVFSAATIVAALANILWLNAQNKKRRGVANPGPISDDRSDGFLYKL